MSVVCAEVHNMGVRAQRGPERRKMGAQKGAGDGPKRLPEPTVGRLSTYLQTLRQLERVRVPTVSSAQVERLTGINAAQFRKDLSYFGEFGTPGVGYDVVHLKSKIREQMGLVEEHRLLVVGAGSLGSALAGYPGFSGQGFHIVALFDNDPAKIGRSVWGKRVHALEEVHEANRELGCDIAMIAVPSEGAQSVVDHLVAAGVRCILNFAPIKVNVPPGYIVRNVDLTRELEVLSYYLSITLAQEAAVA